MSGSACVEEARAQESSAQQVQPLLDSFTDQTQGQDARLEAAAEMAELMDWASPDHAACQFALHRAGMIVAVLEMLDTEGPPIPEALQSAVWHLIGAVALHEAAAAAAVQHLPEMLRLTMPILNSRHTNANLTEACLSALNNLCFRAPSARPLLLPAAPAALRWARQHANTGIEGAACLLLGNMSKNPSIRPALLRHKVVEQLAPLALDETASLQRRGPAMSAVARLDTAVRMKLLAAGALEKYFAPTMRAAVERREGPAGNLPGLDTAEHFALLCDNEWGAIFCAQRGAVHLMQDVVLCDEEAPTRTEDFEGKRWALEALALIARHETVRSLVVAPEDASRAEALRSELVKLQGCEHAGARAGAMRLACRLDSHWLLSLKLLGQRLVSRGTMPPCLWAECVLPYVLGPAWLPAPSPSSAPTAVAV